MTCRVSAAYGSERVDKTPGRSPMEDAILRLEEEERVVQAYIDRMMDLRNEVSRQIEEVENAGHRNLLELRYLCGYSFDRIAVAMDASMGNIYKQHHDALRAFEKIYGRGHVV
jgi:DNA-directed RNA polymerase specialized sigma24 family protein